MVQKETSFKINAMPETSVLAATHDSDITKMLLRLDFGLVNLCVQ